MTTPRQKVWTWNETATTWVGKVTSTLVYDNNWPNDNRDEDGFSLRGYLAERLFTRVMDELEQLVPLLSPYDRTEALAQARSLVKRLRALELADKMSETNGRTDEEIEAFLAKAEMLKQRT